MSENPTASEWTTLRGEKWCANLTGMEATISPVDGPLIRGLRLDAPCSIADVGCGGGGATLAVLRHAPAGSVVHGYDISPALIRYARAREHSAGTVSFEIADMATAKPPGALYQRLVSRFGIMFFDDPPAAFANLRRWLAPGGRFAFAAWGPPAENPWLGIVRDVVAQVVELPPSDPAAPGPFRYGDAAKLLAVLEGAGFQHLAVDDWRGKIAIGGGLPPQKAATFALAAFSSFGELLAEAGEKAGSDAQRSLTGRLSGHQQDGLVCLDACVHIVTGAV